ncbi:MAG: DNA polymerase III subunit delta [Ruminococcus sp.]|nr:DNA polymerase III subunit delta [Ruminococcus sp.]
MASISDKALSSLVRSGKIDSLYLFYGRDVGAIESFTKRLVNKIMPPESADMNLHRFTGKSLDLSELGDIVDAYPLFCERKVVVINDLYLNELKKNDLTYLKDIIKSLDDSTTIIIYITGIDIYRSKTALNKEWASFAKYCEKYGSICEFKPKSLSDLSKAIAAKLSKSGLSISLSDASYLAQVCLCSTTVINNELSKLIFYKQSGEITKEDIDLLCVGQSDTDSFKLANEIVAKRARPAFEILSSLCSKPDEYIATLSSVNSAFCDLYRAKLARSIGATDSDIVEDFSYPANLQFRAKNAYRSCKDYSLKDIRRCIMILSDADYELKSSRCDPEVVVQKAISKMIGLKS